MSSLSAPTSTTSSGWLPNELSPFFGPKENYAHCHQFESHSILPGSYPSATKMPLFAMLVERTLKDFESPRYSFRRRPRHPRRSRRNGLKDRNEPRYWAPTFVISDSHHQHQTHENIACFILSPESQHAQAYHAMKDFAAIQFAIGLEDIPSWWESGFGFAILWMQPTLGLNDF
ncbi:hypothetical protein BO71DRAFT_432102 [Aspergillus ellipticus CBS 707.79]|uniref:Uncharacterized protein n=1 Tax=Aspergillus ellipticus CBS 707.79 TaxID=1448320 RepID=A0A319D4Z6_9EURO|nr:hypothetical protein BO71DRAFT_432102 [Aspergillus ellipticus CBS 707.79]